jgi:hypothetical protein
MSININKAQAEALNDLGSFGEDRPGAPVALTVTEKILVQYGAEFKLELALQMNKAKVTASGKLEDNIIPEILDNGTKLQIKMLDYYDYPNKGVRGVKSSRNAPGSPYKYKNYGMSLEGRKSIKDYIRSGRAKIASTASDKARGIGLERKGVSLLDVQSNTLIYLIKAYGIKSTHYFDKAFDKVFKDFEIVVAETVGRDIVVTLDRINKSPV